MSSKEAIPGYSREVIEGRTTEELKDIAESELEQAEVEHDYEDDVHDIKYRRDSLASKSVEGQVMQVLDTSTWFDRDETDDFVYEKDLGIEEVWVNVLTGEAGLKRSGSERSYNFCGTYDGETAALLELGTESIGFVYDENEDNLSGMNMREGTAIDPTSYEFFKEELAFLKDIYLDAFNQIWHQEQDRNYEIEMLPQVERDLEKLENNRESTLARKIDQVEENLNKFGMSPDAAFNKRRSVNARSILQMTLGSSDRAWFIEGDRLEDGEEGVIYGFRALTHEEADNLDEQFNTTDLTGKEYAEKFI